MLPDTALQSSLAEVGWARIESAVPRPLCEQLVDAMQTEMDLPVRDPLRWDAYGGEGDDLIPIWGHQAQWDVRQLPALHRIWAAAWGTDRLIVSLDSCRFTPPWRPGHAEPLPLHWDHAPRDATKRMIQGVIALTDTTAAQGGFRCAPSLFRASETWPTVPDTDADGDEHWRTHSNGHDIVHVPALTGDLILWDSRLPHANSQNLSNQPRLAFYVMMFPAGDAALRAANVECWESGRCVPWWRDRLGYDRIEPWPSAQLTELGRRLLGLDAWL